MRHAIPLLSLSILAALSAMAIAAKHPAASAAPAQPAASGSTQATVYKDGVAVHKQASATSPTLTSLNKGSAVEVEKQDGLWFNVKAQPAAIGFVKINEIRLAQASGGSNDGFSMFGGHPRPGETAGVRGFDESKLKSGPPDEEQLAAMQALKVDAAAATTYAQSAHLQRTDVAYPHEPGVGDGHKAPSSDQAQANDAAKKAVVGGMLSNLTGRVGVDSNTTNSLIPKSEQEKIDEETYMGPQVAARVLGSIPLWSNPQAQQRVNTIGRWVAMQTPRGDLPWTFAIIDSGEINAFAAPGGYVFMTRALYEVLQSDDEVAAVVGHEISHVVARDHYNVIHKQAMTSAGMGFLASKLSSHGNDFQKQLTDYFAKQGATIVQTSFDRDVEYRSDMASRIYTARAGYNPLAMYAVLQKLAAVSTAGGRLADLYKTHPNANERLDKLDGEGMDAIAPYADRPYVMARR